MPLWLAHSGREFLLGGGERHFNGREIIRLNQPRQVKRAAKWGSDPISGIVADFVN